MMLGPAGIHLPGGLSDSPEKDGQRTPEGFEVRFPLAHLSICAQVMLWCADGDPTIDFRFVEQGPHVASGMNCPMSPTLREAEGHLNLQRLQLCLRSTYLSAGHTWDQLLWSYAPDGAAAAQAERERAGAHRQPGQPWGAV